MELQGTHHFFSALIANAVQFVECQRLTFSPADSTLLNSVEDVCPPSWRRETSSLMEDWTEFCSSKRKGGKLLNLSSSS